MKKLLTLSILSLLLATPFALAQSNAPVKVATVDMAKLFDEYNRAKTVQAGIEADLKKAAAEMERRQNEGRQMFQQMEALRQKFNNEALSKEAREAAKKQGRELEDKIEAKRNEFEKFQADQRKALMDKQNTQREKIYDEIQNAAIAVARKQGANVVLNVSEKTAAGLPVVVFTEKSWDITAQVLTTLNAGK